MFSSGFLFLAEWHLKSENKLVFLSVFSPVCEKFQLLLTIFTIFLLITDSSMINLTPVGGGGSCIIGRPSVYNSFCQCSCSALFTCQGIFVFTSTFLLWRESGALEWWLQLEKWSHSLHVWKRNNYSDRGRVISERQLRRQSCQPVTYIQ